MFEEPIQAWKLGPVVPSLYHEFKRFGTAPITGKSYYMDEDGEISIPSIGSHEDIISVMQKSWGVYKPFTASALVSKTHEPDTPWAKHYKRGRDDIIPDDEIKEYFRRKIREYIDAA